MSPDEMRALIERYIDAYNRFDVTAILAVTHRDVEFLNIANGETTVAIQGADALRALALQSMMMVSERRQTPTSFEFTPEGANVGIHFSATLSVDLPSGMKKGDRMELEGRTEFAFRDGLISRIADISTVEAAPPEEEPAPGA
jgi:ketosteroid isomerase-like protein